MPTSLDLRHQRATVWERMKALVDGAEAENRDLSAEEQTNYARATEDIEALDRRIARLEQIERTPAERQTAPGTQAAVVGGQATEDAAEQSKRQRETFLRFIRHGMAGLSDEERQIMAGRYATLSPEQRALSAGLDTAGGYLVPDDFRRQIESAMLAYGGMREAAYVFATDSGNDLIIPTDNDTSNTGARLGENQSVSEQDVAVGQRKLGAHTYTSKMVKVSVQLLQDAAFDIEGWLVGKLAERIGRATNTDFTVSAGADGPTGLTIDMVSGVTAASATAVAWDELISLEHSVDRAYRVNARYMMHDNTVRDIRKIKDGEGRYLWQPGTTSGAPNTINQFPYTVNNDMPTMATGNKAIAFGQLSKYYIRDVRGFTLLTLRERFADNLQVAFIGFSRHDGKLIDAGGNPVKCITMA